MVFVLILLSDLVAQIVICFNCCYLFDFCFQVMSSGQVVEFDQPVELLEKIDSAFYHLVEQTGQLQQLTAMALAARKRRISVAELSAA